MYAFRKPFNAATYNDLSLGGMDYKSVLIIAQVLGYMLSKFIGIKVISELKASKRILLLLALILSAECALLIFGAVPQPWNFVALFFNGLPLGMVWGVVFSFLEGRRFTEILASGLAVSVVMSSGVLKTIGRLLIDDYGISEFWMPATVGLIFLPLFFLFIWMLAMVPMPSQSDKELRTERVPMNSDDRKIVFRKFWPALIPLVLCFMTLTICRDFRDNFSVEIWTQLGFEGTPSVFAQTEMLIGFVCLIFLGLIVVVKDNIKGLWLVHSLIVAGIGAMITSTVMFSAGNLPPDTWMLIMGFGMYLAYLPFGTVLYERFIAAFRIKGNAGFLMYLSDSTGYLGSVTLLIIKEVFSPEISWLDFFKYLTYATGIIVLFGMALSMWFIRKKNNQNTFKPAAI